MVKLVKKSQGAPAKAKAIAASFIILLFISCAARKTADQVDYKQAYEEAMRKLDECERDLGECMKLGEELRDYVEFK